jgi:hypothetical protein
MNTHSRHLYSPDSFYSEADQAMVPVAKPNSPVLLLALPLLALPIAWTFTVVPWGIKQLKPEWSYGKRVVVGIVGGMAVGAAVSIASSAAAGAAAGVAGAAAKANPNASGVRGPSGAPVGSIIKWTRTSGSPPRAFTNSFKKVDDWNWEWTSKPWYEANPLNDEEQYLEDQWAAGVREIKVQASHLSDLLKRDTNSRFYEGPPSGNERPPSSGSAGAETEDEEVIDTEGEEISGSGEESASNLGLYLGVGAGVLLLGGVGVYLYTRRKAE